MEKRYIHSILIAIVIFSFFFTSGMLKEGYPSGGDNVSHYDLLLNTINAFKIFFKTGELRFWNPNYYFGFPMFFFYAPLPYIFLAFLYAITGIAPIVLFKFSIVLLFSLLPVIFYSAGRFMQLEEEFCFGIALFSTAISSKLVFGLGYYSFFATGLFSQLWGIVFLVFAFAFSYRYFSLNKGRVFFPVFFLFLTFISHFFAGIIAAFLVGVLSLSCLLLGFIRKERKKIISKTIYVILFFLLSVSFFLIPYFINANYFGNITFDLDYKERGYGFAKTLNLLLTGNLLDYSFSFSRLPVLTILFFLGFFLSIFWNRFREKYPILPLFLFISTIFSILLISGKTSFGVLENIPFISSLQTFRFILMFHFIALFYIGIALYFLFSFQTKKYTLFLLLFIIVITPVFYERAKTFQEYATTYLSEDNYNSYYNLNNNSDNNNSDYFKDYLNINQALKQSNFNGRVYITPASGLFDNPQYLQAIPILTGKPIFASIGIGGHDSLSSYYSSLPFFLEHPNLISLFAVDFIIDKKYNGLTVYISQNQSNYFAIVPVPFVLDAKPVEGRDAIITWLFSPALENWQFIEIKELEEKQQPDTFLITNFIITDIQNKESIITLEQSTENFNNKIYGKLDIINNSPSVTVINKNTINYNLDLYTYFQDFNYSNTSHDCGSVLQETHTKGLSKTTVLVKENGCFVLFKMTYHPEWRVFVDSVEKELVMLSPSFMGVAVDSGQHEVIFSYNVSLYRIGLLFLSILSLVVLLFIRK